MFNAHTSTSSIDSSSSFEDLELEAVIGSGGPPTSVLVAEARSIINYMRNDVLATYDNKTIYVGVFLEALLDYAGKDIIPDCVNITGERHTAGIIFAAHRKGKSKVKEIAEAWLQHMVIPMKTASNIRTPQPSEERTPHDSGLAPVAQNKQKQLRKATRQREGYRCPLHKEEILADAPLDAFDAYGESILRRLVVCHTLPFSLSRLAGNDSNTAGKLAIPWIMIKNWTAQSIQELVGEGAHDPTNAILLCPHGRDEFRDFIIYFEPDTEAGPNCYIVKSSYEDEADIRIKFRHLDCIPPPDPRYLAIHRAFAKVLMVTGAGRYFDAYDRDQEYIGALASDGSTNVSMILSKLRLIEVG